MTILIQTLIIGTTANLLDHPLRGRNGQVVAIHQRLKNIHPFQNLMAEFISAYFLGGST